MDAAFIKEVFDQIDIPRGDHEECWMWVGYLDRDGYGRFLSSFEQKTSAHRLVYKIMVGEIPAGLTLDHICRNRSCVNPGHLEPVTFRENLARAVSARTHCKNGHPWTPENTYTTENRPRACRRCTLEGQRRYQARKKERSNVFAR